MKKYHYFLFSALFAASVSGFIIHGWLGGFITGVSASVFVLSTLGKWLHIKSASRIEKSLRDHVLAIESQKDLYNDEESN